MATNSSHLATAVACRHPRFVAVSRGLDAELVGEPRAERFFDSIHGKGGHENEASRYGDKLIRTEGFPEVNTFTVCIMPV